MAVTERHYSAEATWLQARFQEWGTSLLFFFSPLSSPAMPGPKRSLIRQALPPPPTTLQAHTERGRWHHSHSTSTIVGGSSCTSSVRKISLGQQASISLFSDQIPLSPSRIQQPHSLFINFVLYSVVFLGIWLSTTSRSASCSIASRC